MVHSIFETNDNSTLANPPVSCSAKTTRLLLLVSTVRRGNIDVRGNFDGLKGAIVAKGHFRRYGRTCQTLWHGLSCRLR